MPVPDKCITEDAARELQDNWLDTRAVWIQQQRSQGDTREFVFSVSDLEEFIAYVKDLSTQQGFNKPGIRIYFGAYDNALNSNATVFLSATESGEKNSNNNYNIQPYNVVSGGWPPKNY